MQSSIAAGSMIAYQWFEGRCSKEGFLARLRLLALLVDKRQALHPFAVVLAQVDAVDSRAAQEPFAVADGGLEGAVVVVLDGAAGQAGRSETPPGRRTRRTRRACFGDAPFPTCLMRARMSIGGILTISACNLCFLSSRFLLVFSLSLQE